MMISFRYERPNRTPDGRGGEVLAWEFCGQIWGKIVSDETQWMTALEKSAIQKIKIELRDTIGSGIRKGYRLVDNSKEYIITDILSLDKGSAVVFAIKEGEDVL